MTTSNRITYTPKPKRKHRARAHVHGAALGDLARLTYSNKTFNPSATRTTALLKLTVKEQKRH